MKRRRNALRHRGFSLVEVVVSIGILAVLFVGASTLVVSAQKATLGTGAALDLDTEARTAIRQIREDLRSSGWEVDDSVIGGSTNAWDGNMCAIPVPTSATIASDPPFGTAASSTVSAATGSDVTVCSFRRREGFNLWPTLNDKELADWTNDANPAASPGGTAPTVAHSITYVAVRDGKFRNLPGGSIQRYKLQRRVNGVSLGFAVNSLSAVSFTRIDWNTIQVELTFTYPSPEGPSGEPITRRVVEQIQMMNTSANTNN